ncbi:MAG: tRNA 2-thiouridine synthesizing protein E [Halioglobus sp.]|jgi:tRNA 2-thiouridine synthesizing protein E
MKPENRTDSERFDKEGFLRKLDDWTPHIATEIAATEGIQLQDSHWELVSLIRQYYQDFDSSPSMRPLVKYIRLKLGAEKGKSIYLLSQFPGSPAKIGSKIAGLPKPDNCL